VLLTDCISGLYDVTNDKVKFSISEMSNVDISGMV